MHPDSSFSSPVVLHHKRPSVPKEFQSPPAKKQKTQIDQPLQNVFFAHRGKQQSEMSPQLSPVTEVRKCQKTENPRIISSPAKIETWQSPFQTADTPQVYTTRAQDGFTLQSSSSGQRSEFKPLTPVKKAHRRGDRSKHQRSIDETQTPELNSYFVMMAANHSFNLRLENDKITPHSDVHNKFMTQYEILKQIGEGSFGVVFKCQHRQTGSIVSVKQSKLKYEGSKDRLQKLEEVYKVLKLTANQTSEECPVVMLREAWEEGGYLYMCSDYCQLGNLYDFTKGQPQHNHSDPQLLEQLTLKRRSSLLVKSRCGVPMMKESKIWQYFEQMARCILHVHERGIVHLDIKPQNFLINASHQVRLTDFGISVELAKIREIADVDQCGDSIYMAPELLKTNLPCHERITKKCDVFSLGICMLHLASSMNLPSNGDIWEKLRSGHQIVFSPSTQRSQHLTTLINRMMEPDPIKRPSIEEILLHPIFAHKSSSFMMDESSFVPPPHNTEKQVILISPSTVAQEEQRLLQRQSYAPFEVAKDQQQNAIGRTNSFQLVQEFYPQTQVGRTDSFNMMDDYGDQPRRKQVGRSDSFQMVTHLVQQRSTDVAPHQQTHKYMHHYEFSSSGASNNYPMRDSQSSDAFDTKRVLQFDESGSDVFLQKHSSQLSQVDDQKLRQQLFYQRSQNSGHTLSSQDHIFRESQTEPDSQLFMPSKDNARRNLFQPADAYQDFQTRLNQVKISPYRFNDQKPTQWTQQPQKLILDDDNTQMEEHQDKENHTRNPSLPQVKVSFSNTNALLPLVQNMSDDEDDLQALDEETTARF